MKNLKVSVLIPARNEEENLPILLESLQKQDYTNLEIIILDDGSTDKTFEIATTFSQNNERIKIVKGEILPANWFGKNWACHQLSQIATGHYFLFTDADVFFAPNAISQTISTFNQNHLELLSLFPEQITKTLGEKTVVPLMHYILLTLLPLSLILKSKNPAFAAANGQFMLFSNKSYSRFLWHEKVKNKVTEDIEILRLMKKNGLRTQTLLGNGLVFCRMYKNLKDAIHGFSKNMFAGFGNNLFLVITYCFLTFFSYFIILFYINIFSYLLLLLGIAILRPLLALLGKQQFLIQLLLHPLQMLIFLYIITRSVYLWQSGKTTWKGRYLIR